MLSVNFPQNSLSSYPKLNKIKQERKIPEMALLAKPGASAPRSMPPTLASLAQVSPFLGLLAPFAETSEDFGGVRSFRGLGA